MTLPSKCLACLIHPTTSYCQGCKKKLCKDCANLRKRESNEKYVKAKELFRKWNLSLYYDLRKEGISIKPIYVPLLLVEEVCQKISDLADEVTFTPDPRRLSQARYYFKGKLLCKDCQC